MSIVVIESLEVIDVDHQECERPSITQRLLPHAHDMLIECLSVDTRQAVTRGHLGD